MTISTPSMPPPTAEDRPRRRGRAALAAGLGLAATSVVLVVTAAAASASAYPVTTSSTDSVNLRDCYHPTKQSQPSTSCSVITTLGPSTPLTLVCQHTGTSQRGDVWWDYVKTQGGTYGYVADTYVNTGYPGKVPNVDTCNY